MSWLMEHFDYFFQGERSKALGLKAFLFEMCDYLSKLWL